MQGLSFETGPCSKIAILTILFRKNENIGVYILPTVVLYFNGLSPDHPSNKSNKLHCYVIVQLHTYAFTDVKTFP